MVASELELHKYATNRQPRLITAMTMLKSHLFK
jgi:20S proteasome subunit beta 2